MGIHALHHRQGTARSWHIFVLSFPSVLPALLYIPASLHARPPSWQDSSPFSCPDPHRPPCPPSRLQGALPKAPAEHVPERTPVRRTGPSSSAGHTAPRPSPNRNLKGTPSSRTIGHTQIFGGLWLLLVVVIVFFCLGFFSLSHSQAHNTIQSHWRRCISP